MWIWDVGGEGWMAPSLSHLIDACLGYAERGWLTVDDHDRIALSAKAEVDANAKEAEHYAQHPELPQHLFVYEAHVEILRLTAFEDPSRLAPFRRDWIW